MAITFLSIFRNKEDSILISPLSGLRGGGRKYGIQRRGNTP
jgi:hypothetical protein